MSKPMETIQLDTLLFTGWKYLASSCWFKIEFVGRRKDHLYPYACTTRNGLLDFERKEHITGLNPTYGVRVHYFVTEKYATGLEHLRSLMDRLEHIWFYPMSAGQTDADRKAGTSNWVPADVHHYSHDGTRRTKTHLGKELIPRLMVGVPYRVQMDWAMPYCLLSKEHKHENRIFPFGLRTSENQGEPLKGKWNTTKIIRIKKAADFESSRIYETEILDANGKVKHKVIPPRWKKGEPSWMKEVDVMGEKKPRARLMMPFTDGFLLLHKFFIEMMKAYNLLNAYRLAQSNVQKDLFLLAQIDHMLDLTADSVDPGKPPDSDTLPQIREAHNLTEKLRRLAKGFEPRINRKIETKNLAEPFDYLIDFTASKSYAKADKNWYRFAHYLGPLSFLELAVWLIRQSPFHEKYYQKYGGMLLQTDGKTWTGERDQKKDPMLVDMRYRGKPSDDKSLMFVDSRMSWARRSAKILSTVNQMFYYHHCNALMWTHHWATTATAPKLVPFKITMEKIKDFVKFITNDKNAAKFLDTHVRDLKAFSTPQMQAAVKVQNTQLVKKVDKVQFPKWKALPVIANSLDALHRTIRLMAIAASFDKIKWDGESVAYLAYNTLGLTKATASLLGAGDRKVIAKVIGPLGAAVETGLYAKLAVSNFEVGDYYTGAMRAMQATGSALCCVATYTRFVPLAGIPLSTVLVLVGTALILAAEIALWIQDNWNEEWENHTLKLYGALQQDVCEFKFRNVRTYKYDHIYTRPVVIGSFGPLVREYGKKKKDWFGTKDGRRLEKLIKFDDTWEGFPEWRWRYLEHGQENDPKVRKNYEAYCKRLYPMWKPDTPPPRLPHAAASF